MSTRQELIKKDLKALVKLITGFDETDENFHHCVSYAESNFKYHRYLSPDSHKIHRAIDGLCEKFEVHSQKQKAMQLKELTAKFLDMPGLDGRGYGKTDVHYAMLSLLLNLAETPTKVDFHPQQQDTNTEEVDDFDWRRYLLEDLDLNFATFKSSDSEDDDEWSLPDSYEDSEGDQEGKRKQDILPRRLSESDGDFQQVFPRVLAQSSTAANLGIGGPEEYKQLEDLLTVEYWKRKGKEEETAGDHTASNLVRDWNYYKSSTNEFFMPLEQSVVTEHQVYRETLWMLSGSKELFIFQFDGKDFRLRSDVYVMHLTSESLENLLKPLMVTAAQVCKLQALVNDITSHVCDSIATGDSLSVPQTYQSFASCVAVFLKDFRKQLMSLEKAAMKQDNITTLSKLTYDLQPWVAKVHAVHGIYISGIASVWTHIEDTTPIIASNCLKASLLLDALYEAVYQAELISLCDDDGMASFLLEVLVKSSRPLIEIISDWINKGQLIDPAGEFIVQRNKKIPSLNETFWENAFVPNYELSQEVSILDVTSQKLPNKEPASTASNTKLANQSKCNNTSGQISQSKVGCNHPDVCWKHGPRFLQPILGDAVLTGKSMEILENLGRMREVLDTDHCVYERPPSLYELFVRSLSSKMVTKANEKYICDSDSHNIDCLINNDSVENDLQFDKLLDIQGEQDTLMAISFANMFPDINKKSSTNIKKGDDEFPVQVNNSFSASLRLCESCLHPNVRTRCKIVCAKLVNILGTEYHLMDCIEAMQRYYLMASGDVMYDFYTPIFEKIANKEFWNSAPELELHLHEAVGSRFPEDLTKLTVTVNSTIKKNRRPINLTDSIQLKYTVPWPVNIVISGRCQEMYNDVFTFLLQIKRAKYSVDQLRFEDLSKQETNPSELPAASDLPTEDTNEMSNERVHRCHLLRFRLLYFVNSLHTYFMTRILHSTGLEFAPCLKKAADFEQIILVHRQYAEAIHERCLLHQNLAFLKEAVVSVLNLSVTFSTLWRQGLQFINLDALQEMETELSRCSLFLSSFLNNVIKRGSFPHLESLAFHLISSL